MGLEEGLDEKLPQYRLSGLTYWEIEKLIRWKEEHIKTPSLVSIDVIDALRHVPESRRVGYRQQINDMKCLDSIGISWKEKLLEWLPVYGLMHAGIRFERNKPIAIVNETGNFGLGCLWAAYHLISAFGVGYAAQYMLTNWLASF